MFLPAMNLRLVVLGLGYGLVGASTAPIGETVPLTGLSSGISVGSLIESSIIKLRLSNAKFTGRLVTVTLLRKRRRVAFSANALIVFTPAYSSNVGGSSSNTGSYISMADNAPGLTIIRLSERITPVSSSRSKCGCYEISGTSEKPTTTYRRKKGRKHSSSRAWIMSPPLDCRGQETDQLPPDRQSAEVPEQPIFRLFLSTFGQPDQKHIPTSLLKNKTRPSYVPTTTFVPSHAKVAHVIMVLGPKFRETPLAAVEDVVT
ncbi:hypothetical protein T265_07634 [Opisthorchis viverrini]|uniref:Uncharacterized protein n=1 Tax=Opisthorchis viverrini TaxID=6198 RepID=A0A074ZC69_OPIVI|nr:hypothetical protein T265_07634 [Opisthorchis viverrini]KER24743.1 hypothetical protein T265_07634 [Opisthorchis viverrini]